MPITPGHGINPCGAVLNAGISHIIFWILNRKETGLFFDPSMNGEKDRRKNDPISAKLRSHVYG